MKKYFIDNKSNVWFWIFLSVSVVLFFLLPIMSLDSGNSGDEDTWQYPQAQKIYNFYATGGTDTTYKSVPEMNPYGMWFDTFTVVVVKAFKIDDYQTTRHIMNSIFGFFAILFAGLFAKNCKGWRAGVITILLLAISPRFLGHLFNNPKDIPFAAMFMISIFFIHKFILEYPKPTIKTCIMLAIAMGLSVSIRVGGILLYAYFGLFVVAYYISINKPKNYLAKQNMPIVGKLFVKYICIIIGAFLISIPLWPYIMTNPLHNTIQAFKDLSHFAVSLRQLFEGEMQWSDALPWYYTPKYILITIPIAVIIGMLVYPFIDGWKKENRFTTFMVYFAFIFPIFWIVYSNANVYGGWRHALFTYPPMVVAAGLGFNALIDLVKNKYGKIALTILPFLLPIHPLLHIIRNHPYEYVYFNELSGGMNKAYGNYEMDYYYHSTREASEWVLANAKKSGMETGKKIKVATWHSASVNYFFRKDTADFQVLFSRWYERGNNDWDYAIFTVTGMMPEQIKSTHFPPPNTVHTIDVDGKPICIILKRTDKSDLEGFKLKEAKQTVAAIPYLKKALKVDPYNEATLMNLIECYFQVGFLDSAKTLIDHLLAFVPSYEPANYLNAHYYISKGDADMALKSCKKIIKDNFKFKAAYYLACKIHLGLRDLNSAEKVLGELIDTDQIDNQGIQMLIQIYMDQGLNKQGAYKKLYKKMGKSLEKRGKEKKAKEFWDMYHKL
ncbi:MAG TPA: tetratricopeptide repeat protein [Bacteroidales bacterium]|nr:tetratricopeptide repeat protein [Bacteroidales bacterium]